MRRTLTVGLLTAGLVGVLASLAAAVLTPFAGSTTVDLVARTETNPATTSSVAWQDVPGALVPVAVKDPGATLLARFSAESMCANLDGSQNLGLCSVRIVAFTQTGGVIELHPQANTDYTFDNTADGRTPEAHAQERLLRVPPGDLRVGVQYRVSSAATALTLDDWTFVVEQVAF